MRGSSAFSLFRFVNFFSISIKHFFLPFVPTVSDLDIDGFPPCDFNKLSPSSSVFTCDKLFCFLLGFRRRFCLKKTKLKSPRKHQMPEQIPVFPSRRWSHCRSKTVRTLALILSLFNDDSHCSPAIRISPEAPKLGLGTQQELCNDLVDHGGLKPENLSIESTKAVGIHNGTSSPEHIVTNQLDERTRSEGYEYLVCREVCTPSNMSVEKDLLANSGTVPINDRSEHLISEQTVPQYGDRFYVSTEFHQFPAHPALGMDGASSKSGEVGGIMEDRELSKLSGENAGVNGFPKGASELEQIVTKESEHGTRLEGNENIACSNSVHSHSNSRMEEDLVADIVVVSSDNHFNNSLLEQNDVVGIGNVAGKVEYAANFDFSNKSSEEFAVQDGASSPKQSVTVDFGHRMELKGNGDLTFGDILKDTHISLEKDQVANEVGVSINNYNNGILCSERIDVDVLPKVPEVIESELLKSKSMLENDLIPYKSMSVNNAKNGASLAHMVKKQEYAMQRKELDLKESPSYKVTPDFSVSFVSDGGIEDGEIPNDSGVSDHSFYSYSEDAVLASKGVGGRVFGKVMKKEKFSDKCKKHKGEYEDCVQAELNGRKRKEQEARFGTLVINEKKKGNGSKEDINCSIAPPEVTQLHEEMLDKNATQTCPMTSKKKDVESYDKKKRGPLTENRKMMKKLQKKRKRAEINKLVGVKRLKLKPVLKPKPVTYCKHYLRGRCRQGDLCKFSHDTIPLTKSMPCKHFAYHSCLKGDDCPFDHELSNYPCDNYMSKGSCIRGDKCLFSHKILPKEGTSTSLNAGKLELESSALLDRNLRKEVNIDSSSCCNVNNLSKDTSVWVPFSVGTIPHSKPYQNVVGKRLKPLVQVPRGIRFLVNGNTPLDDSNRKQHGDFPSNGCNGIEICNQERESVPDKHQNLNEMLGRAPPAVPPSGIRFLSMGKVPLSDPAKQQGGGFPSKQDGVELCNLKNLSASHKLQNPNESAVSLSKPPVSIGHSMTPLAEGNDKSVQSSSQKALSSTLAFAAKHESEMWLGHSTSSPAFFAEVSKASRNNSNFSTGNSQNEPMKTNKILEEFLFGVSGNGNQ
ncbi:uncharacterized protein LOC122072156 isoform X2 [Macadamia integrifolia]|uniref:uncharacterized protein LOC122072156 isoform X2 n=1 Tax=Macadamia integrifolia TaxID=60698 RepID=UPI001C4E34F4|nr:uncharacterized protein LOC122072156 isoform X2 [Macadamia integrifolia]